MRKYLELKRIKFFQTLLYFSRLLGLSLSGMSQFPSCISVRPGFLTANRLAFDSSRVASSNSPSRVRKLFSV